MVVTRAEGRYEEETIPNEIATVSNHITTKPLDPNLYYLLYIFTAGLLLKCAMCVCQAVKSRRLWPDKNAAAQSVAVAW